MLAVVFLISLAPSTKSDELYQLAETLFHATNTADAGNILSLEFGIQKHEKTFPWN